MTFLTLRHAIDMAYYFKVFLGVGREVYLYAIFFISIFYVKIDKIVMVIFP